MKKYFLLCTSYFVHCTFYFVLSTLYLVLCTLSGCKKSDPVANPTNASNTFASGYAVFYGSYYDYLGITENVVTLSLLSPNLSIDTAGYYVGTGTNLILTDIFINPSDTFLPQGHYTVNDNGTAMTFLPGKSYDGNVIGAYMLIITDTGYSTEILPEGDFDLTTKGDSVFIDFNFKRTNNKTYTPSFKGVLPMYDGR